MNELMSEVPAPSRLARIMFSVAAVYLGLLTLLLIGLGLLTLDSRCGHGFRYTPWFTLAATTALIGWAILNRHWWTPTAMLIGPVLSGLLLLFILDASMIVTGLIEHRGGFGALALLFLVHAIAYWTFVVIAVAGLVLLVAVLVQRRFFNRPLLQPGEKRRLQFPLWAWIPLIAIVGLEGCRIHHGDAARIEHQRGLVDIQAK